MINKKNYIVKNYEHHGEEHNHLDDLIVLCSGCHSKFHDKLAVGE